MQPTKNNRQWLLSSPALQQHVNEQWFHADYWAQQDRLLGTYSGRGSVWIIKSEHGKWILKHYFRGGLYAKVNQDKYLWSGVNNTRAVREFKLLEYLQTKQLPSPKPVAVRVLKSGLFYANDLITEYIQHETTFAKQLLNQQTSPQAWARIGQVVAQFHRHHVYHADLNAHNLLINGDQVILIDFDKGELKNNKKDWPQANIARLKRSIEKETNHSCDRTYADHWQALTKAYKQALTD